MRIKKMADVNLNRLPQRGTALMGALADPTRKAIFNLLLEKPTVVKVLSADLPVSQSAVSQHLKVMKEAGLIVEEKQGRTHLYSVNPVALDWLSWQFGLIRDDLLNEDVDHHSPQQSSEYDAVDMAMESWTQQWSELDTLSNGLMLRLCLIGRHLEGLFERLAARFDMTSEQVLILSTLDRISSHESSLSELSRISFTQITTTESHLQPLEVRGYIERTQDPDDSDGILIKMTDSGKLILHEILDMQKTHDHAPIYQMDTDKRLKMVKLLRPLLFDLRERMKHFED